MSKKLKDVGISLETYLATMVGLPEVAWPNVEFNFDADEMYIRPYPVPGPSVSIGMEDTADALNMGMYQVDIFIPKGEGVKRAVDLAQEISDHFAKGTELDDANGRVRITGSDIQSGGTNVGSHFQISLLIRYTSIISQGA